MLEVADLAVSYGTVHAVRRARITLEPGSGVRKATGTLYTPQPIAEHLVRQTLAPLVDRVPPERAKWLAGRVDVVLRDIGGSWLVGRTVGRPHDGIGNRSAGCRRGFRVGS